MFSLLEDDDPYFDCYERFPETNYDHFIQAYEAWAECGTSSWDLNDRECYWAAYCRARDQFLKDTPWIRGPNGRVRA